MKRRNLTATKFQKAAAVNGQKNVEKELKSAAEDNFKFYSIESLIRESRLFIEHNYFVC